MIASMTQIVKKTLAEKEKIDKLKRKLLEFLLANGCKVVFEERPTYRVLDVSHCNQDGILHVYYGTFPSDMPDAECLREVVRELAHLPSGLNDGKPVMNFKLFGLNGISSFEELDVKLTIMQTAA